MPRPMKCRKVCRLPQHSEFGPQGVCGAQPVVLNVDEYEAIRLIDHMGFSQEECGAYMHIARTTVQQVYAAARRKIACALVEGRGMRIEGGNYRLCDGNEERCGCGGCRRHRCQPGENREEQNHENCSDL